MIGIILQLMLLVQGIPTLPNQGGTVTGVLTTEAARPAAGVRVAVMVQPENPEDVANVASLVSIAETDDAGKFILNDVPPGRYYVTAGRVESPTYYPGTSEIASGKIVTVSSGTTVSGVNFILKDVSDRGVEIVNAALRIPIHILLDDGVRIPVFSERGKVRIGLTHDTGKTTEISLGALTLTLPIAAGEYRVRLENLPDGYTLNSLTYGATNLLNDTLKVTLNDLPAPAKGEQIFLTNTLTGIVIQRRIQGSNSYNTSGVVSGSVNSTSELSLSLTRTALADAPSPGVHVRGKVIEGQEEAYISGVPGTLYSDGSFEFAGVNAGSHVVAVLGGSSTSRQLATMILVGSNDVDNVQLKDMNSLPLDVLSPGAGSTQSPSDLSKSPTHSIRGHVVEGTTHHPVAGIVTLQGYDRSITYSLPADGELEVPDLLPGSYGLKIETFDRSSLTRIVVVESDDLELNLTMPSIPPPDDFTAPDASSAH